MNTKLYALWQANLNLKIAHAQRYPFAIVSYHLLRYGVSLHPSFLGGPTRYSSSAPAQVQTYTKSIFKMYTCFTESEVLLCDANLNQLVNSFWKEIFDADQDKYMLVQLRIKSEGGYYSLSKLQTVNYSDKQQLIDILIFSLRTYYERYTQFSIENIFIRYTILPDNSPLLLNRALNKDVLDNSYYDSVTMINYPTTLDLAKWGFKVTNITNSVFNISADKCLYTVVVKDKTRIITVAIGSKVETSFTDIVINQSRDEFKRILESGLTIFYKNGAQVKLIHPQKEGAFIKPEIKDTSHTFRAITLDLETRMVPFTHSDGTVEDLMEVISAATYDGKNYHTWFINDYPSSEDMIKALIQHLFLRYPNKRIYVHNFSDFDGIFLLRILAESVDNLDTIIKDGKFISLKATKRFGPMLVSINFNDSLLLLPSSLKSLGKAFGVGQKGEFDLNKSMNARTPLELEAIRDELLQYNKQDCLVLYQVLQKFSKLIYNMFNLNIDKIPTLSSLALHIYKSNYMPTGANISITDTDLYSKLHAAYTGGAVDVFTPQSLPGEKVYCYDVNSLYPSVMLQQDFPVGDPTFVEGHIDLNAPDTFGFMRVEVTTPTDLHVPLLQTKLEGRTVCALGTWTGWYFSEELKMAQKLGYRFNVLEGVLYNRSRIFEEYVNSLYEMRLTYPKSDPRNLICKLLLNSLYGKFGMSPYLSEWKLVNQDLSKLVKGRTKSASDWIDLGSKALVAFPDIKNLNVEKSKSKNEAYQIMAKLFNVTDSDVPLLLANNPDANRMFTELTMQRKYLDISLPIAASVTAYARMSIYNYKNAIIKDGGTLYYSDTDSVFSSIPLDDSLVGDGLGKMKLEYVAERAVFLAPKVYAIELADGFKKQTDSGYIFKIKGAKKNHGLSYSDLEALLYKDASIEISLSKWFKRFGASTINVRNLVYTLKVTENKRTLVYRNNKFVGTQPFVILDGNVTSTVSVETRSTQAMVPYDPNAYAIVRYEL